MCSEKEIKIPKQNFCRWNKKSSQQKSNMFSQQSLTFSQRRCRFVNYSWLCFCPGCRACPLPVANCRNHFHSLLSPTLFTLPSGHIHLRVAHSRSFCVFISCFLFFLSTTHRVLMGQWWPLLSLLSPSCDLLPWPPPRHGHGEMISICFPLFSYYCPPQT